MRAYEIRGAGLENLVLAERPDPEPLPHQVLVRMRAASLNYRDLAIVAGHYPGVRPNVVALSDGAGEVVRVGSEVTRVKVGDRVAGIFTQGWEGGEMCPEDRGTTLGGPIDGVLSEFRAFDERGVVLLPEHLSYEEGATLPCAAVTAWNALYGLNPLRAGETVLVLGTGGVSVFALQLARAAGARVIATSSSDEKLERARELGASDGINYRAHPEWDREVRRLTGGRGVDHVVEVGGAGTLARSIASARLGGSITLIGVLTGGQIDPMPILRGNVIVRGILVGSRQMFEEMNRLITLHQLRPVIDRVFPFEEAAEAYRHLQSQTHVGKVVIRIGG